MKQADELPGGGSAPVALRPQGSIGAAFWVLPAAIILMVLVAQTRDGGTPLWPVEMGPNLDMLLFLTTLVMLFVVNRQAKAAKSAAADGSQAQTGAAAARMLRLGLGLAWASAGFCFAVNVGDAALMAPYAVVGLLFALTGRG